MTLSTSIVVCAYTEERWGDLVAAVESLRRQTRAPLEMILVSDHNRALYERARSLLPDVVAVENEETRGLSGARNTGVTAAQGEIVAFLDDDAVAEPDWLERLAAHYTDPKVIGVGGSVDADWLEGRPRFFPREFDWVVGCSYRGMPESTSRVRNPIGANMSFRAQVLSRTGGFTSGIGRVGTRPVGCEETELCIRAARQHPEGIILYDPAARVHHRVPASRAHWRYFRSRCYSEGLSKALVSGCAGPADALSAERSYALRTLPSGVWQGLGRAIAGDPGGLGRAGAIVAGLAITSYGYGAGILAARRASSRRGTARDGVVQPVPVASK